MGLRRAQPAQAGPEEAGSFALLDFLELKVLGPLCTRPCIPEGPMLVALD